jgi:hypothetical protein
MGGGVSWLTNGARKNKRRHQHYTHQFILIPIKTAGQDLVKLNFCFLINEELGTVPVRGIALNLLFRKTTALFSGKSPIYLIRIRRDPHFIWKLDPEPYRSKKLEPDPN